MPKEMISNPEYELWEAKDKQVLNYLLCSISHEILIQVSTASTAAELWTAIRNMFASKSRGRVIHTRMALATAQKGASTIAEYFGKMKTLAEDMASTGKRLDDEELASYILAGLDIEFNPIVSVVAARTKPISLGELYTQLISFVQRMDLLHGGSFGSSENSTAHGGNGGNNYHGNGRGRGNGGGRGHGRGGGGGRGGSNTDRYTFICHLRGKEGHTVIRCYKRFDASFTDQEENKSTSFASASYGVYTNWYCNTLKFASF